MLRFYFSVTAKFGMTIINYSAKEPEPEWIWLKIIWRNESHRKWANSVAVIVFFLCVCCLKMSHRSGSGGYKMCGADRRFYLLMSFVALLAFHWAQGLKEAKKIYTYRAPWRMFTISCSFSFSFSFTSLLPVFLFFFSFVARVSQRSHLYTICYVRFFLLLFVFFFTVSLRCCCCFTFI